MRKLLPVLVLLACAAVFAFGLLKLFELRFQSGDVYPPYSSLRADPLGTMAFYESLGKLPGLVARRDFSASNRLPEEPGTVYLSIAAAPEDWNWVPSDLHHEIKKFLSEGGRLVVAFYPQTEKMEEFSSFSDEPTNSVRSARHNLTERKTPPARAVKKRAYSAADSEDSLNDEWGFHPGFIDLPTDGDEYAPTLVKNLTDLPLPKTLGWHSGLVFTNCDSAWRTVYARGTRAVIIERRFGKGSVVLAGDSYFLSNEAMAKDRHADLLAWVLGSGRNVVFDESHFGIVDTSGVATLMRQYHLQGLVAGLILLAMLFIWKNSTSLLPADRDEKLTEVVAGKDAASGFVNLLRRNIAPVDLLATCFTEWKKSSDLGGPSSPLRHRQAEAIFQAENAAAPRDRNPVAAYRNISTALGHQKHKT